MAKEAVIKIKEAEDAAAEVIRAASEKARLIAEESKAGAIGEKEAVVKSAEQMKNSLMENARKEADESLAPIIAEGLDEIEKILKPDSAKFEKAVKTVMERIVNTIGDR